MGTATEYDVREFKADDWWHIKGRGDVASVRNDEEYENGCRHLIGEKVSIDGHVYTVKGVEAPCIQTIRKGVVIGLLVHEPRALYTDEELERLIDAEYAGICDQSKPIEQCMQHMIRMVELIRQRSLAQIYRMELERGLLSALSRP